MNLCHSFLVALILSLSYVPAGFSAEHEEYDVAFFYKGKAITIAPLKTFFEYSEPESQIIIRLRNNAQTTLKPLQSASLLSKNKTYSISHIADLSELFRLGRCVWGSIGLNNASSEVLNDPQTQENVKKFDIHSTTLILKKLFEANDPILQTIHSISFSSSSGNEKFIENAPKIPEQVIKRLRAYHQ